MSDVFLILGEAQRAKLRAADAPAWTAPMLATLTRDAFSDPDWLYERKLDGVRCLVFRNGREIRLLSRNRKPMNDTWPELVRELAAQRCPEFVADGEIVAFVRGRTSFARLQQRIGIQDPRAARGANVDVHLYLFDLLHLEGYDVTRLPLRDRKRLLKRALSFGGHVRFTPHRWKEGEKLLADACRRGWEGLIAKRADSVYEHRRSPSWRKLKCGGRQELVIGGYTDPKGSRSGLGALLLGYYDDGTLRYAGKVGTGFDDATLRSLAKRLGALERSDCPFHETPREKAAHWVDPRLVCEVGFTEWTTDGKLRHPRFLGLRDDKRPKQVRRERATSAPI